MENREEKLNLTTENETIIPVKFNKRLSIDQIDAFVDCCRGYAGVIKTDVDFISFSAVAKRYAMQQKTFNRIEIAEVIEHIFKNTERIHGKSKTIDWIKIGSHKAAEYILPKIGLEKLDELVSGDNEVNRD